MIHSTGFYQTRDGRIVEITKIYSSQPIAEGIMEDKSYVWNLDGTTDRWKESPRDIVKFITSDWSNIYTP